uniref:Uncharacterized protein n=1 Tax=Tetraselmis chuii TaxID=63592 RepID=A0A7S1SPI5_9CHLO|mmetsp:Transcript_22824/g.40630  ORF Transcript_22824/g.40630 Transcript_22824/m.40630 type:complete len:104 (+) Transcript_22824:206-517(+)|eukprot:CAMPEP_0177775458 /NCGR_PEP_ID=MMETSP0491_2-20121128/14126_1 /TAXON_ID=63592 /ORGANISM="Tetraselmis chuii, Strain PLY429" /LENGTH=103 /DNA_ID=CAMNT_0019294055 /DNA_START=158 /DNA_END=469 /DNA_ORIENTATION=+
MLVSEYIFQLSSGSCSGSFWRGSPLTGSGPSGNTSDWPKNGAGVKGVVHDVPSKGQWLEVTEIRQAGGSEWASVEGQGKWLPFNGGSNGGQWLHAPDAKAGGL